MRLVEYQINAVNAILAFSTFGILYDAAGGNSDFRLKVALVAIRRSLLQIRRIIISIIYHKRLGKEREFEIVFTRSILRYFWQKRHNLTGYATKTVLFLCMKSV